MRMRMNGLSAVAMAVVAAAVALVGSAGVAHAAKPGKGLGKPVARGKVSDLNTTKKTFVVTNKKAGAITVAYTDATKFKKVSTEEGAKATDAAVSDLKNGAHAVVQGTASGSAVTATEVTIGHKRKKKAAAAGTAAPAGTK